MARVQANAGAFDVECFTDGYPLWVDISYNGNSVIRTKADNLPDLLYAVQRLVGKLEQEAK